MPTVREILAEKGSKVFTVTPDVTVLEATEKMNRHRIGALVVMSGEQVSGMFTERDVLTRVVAVQRSPAEILVSEVMTSDVVCCRPTAEIDEIAAVMKERRIRHIPVCNEDGRLEGLISMGDVNAHNASSQLAQIHFLNEYVFGRA